jgi:hypothetical protein
LEEANNSLQEFRQINAQLTTQINSQENIFHSASKITDKNNFKEIN